MSDDMHIRDVQLRARAEPWSNGVRVAAFGMDEHGRRVCASQPKWGAVSDRAEAPTLALLRMEYAQSLMDDLWAAGLRPTEGSGSAGAMRATERHIEDLRFVSFRLLDVVAAKEGKS